MINCGFGSRPHADHEGIPRWPLLPLSMHAKLCLHAVLCLCAVSCLRYMHAEATAASLVLQACSALFACSGLRLVHACSFSCSFSAYYMHAHSAAHSALTTCMLIRLPPALSFMHAVLYVHAVFCFYYMHDHSAGTSPVLHACSDLFACKGLLLLHAC